ncbi:MAG TPA: sigma-70 family RNA polymerase sigma factor [Blastocatellia bacterium]|jgi:RNA polymerase sigma factor (TIGR02999 family)|nr:sigma-70 family RNA polymerase sigma factor [Blastocatellia bacterium]
MRTTHEITNLLVAWGKGDQEALDQLVPLVNAELQRLARGYLMKERPGHILQTTALIHEAYIRLIDWQNSSWQNRAHFFGVAADMMRRILVDYAVKWKSEKRGGGALHVTLVEAAAVFSERAPDLVELDAALVNLAALNPRQCRVIVLRFFGGMTLEEIAEALGVSLGTVKRDLTLAKLWLLGELKGGHGDDA